MPDKIEPNQKAVADFISRWEASGSAERADYTMFLTELCALLGVPRRRGRLGHHTAEWDLFPLPCRSTAKDTVNATGLLHPLRSGDVRPLGVFHGHAVFQLTLGHDDDSFRQPRVDGRSGQALPDAEILRRLVALNAERAEEEKRGLIRWLRPEFQNPTGRHAGQGTLGIADKPAAGKAKKAEKLP